MYINSVYSVGFLPVLINTHKQWTVTWEFNVSLLEAKDTVVLIIWYAYHTTREEATLNTPIINVLPEIVCFTQFMTESNASSQHSEHFEQPSLSPYIQKYDALKSSL